MIKKYSICIIFFVMGSMFYGTASLQRPNILLTMLGGDTWGGMESHVFNRYKTLVKHNYPTSILLIKGSKFEQKLKQAGTQFFACSKDDYEQKLVDACKSSHIDIVITPTPLAFRSMQAVKGLPVKIIAVEHMHPSSRSGQLIESLCGIDAISGVSPQVVNFIERINNQKSLNIKNIAWIPPFFEEEKFSRFVPNHETRNVFFKKHFNIDISSAPVVCMIGNMYADLRHKNYPLLFQAIQKLVQKGRGVQVMLAGDGSQRDYLERLVRKMGLEKQIHFLGFWADTPSLLFHSDFFVLASEVEACAQVIVEAGMMGKPSIGARGTGAEAVIVDGKTGLLFENRSADDLANKIEFLLDNPVLCLAMGRAAAGHVRDYFSNEAQFVKLEKLIKTIMAG